MVVNYVINLGRMPILQGLCDARAQETLAAKKEGDKWREEVRQVELKHTAVAGKLKAEADCHR